MLGGEHNAEGVSFWMKFLYFRTKSRLKTVGAFYMGHVTLQRPQYDLFCYYF